MNWMSYRLRRMLIKLSVHCSRINHINHLKLQNSKNAAKHDCLKQCLSHHMIVSHKNLTTKTGTCCLVIHKTLLKIYHLLIDTLNILDVLITNFKTGWYLLKNSTATSILFLVFSVWENTALAALASNVSLSGWQAVLRTLRKNVWPHSEKIQFKFCGFYKQGSDVFSSSKIASLMPSAILIYIRGEGGTCITHRLGVQQPFHPMLYSALIIVIKMRHCQSANRHIANIIQLKQFFQKYTETTTYLWIWTTKRLHYWLCLIWAVPLVWWLVDGPYTKSSHGWRHE